MKALLWIGISLLIVWFIRDVWVYRIGVFFDLRIWLLAIPLYFLYRKINKSTGKGIADHTKANDTN